ncbi:hypothetical protein G647_08101 [Cladophialophora carrionii CBS 160.54]|uniref:Nucleolar 27S pre-rRNA processing Urb2/Npa2 C-terminal domain-containing protein n=1 Tax=Cladophialophora carrionii CBS 160.54 TaxID=1279043 RepID=V9D249_9EURO|nr:uncharacterized protein G647_08101 [Cladophialophora carrionii CBS 160.54]ETI20067.1 hypothetical protein G647_08101 [Cladophialophora carrionii CBS 160.54]
MVWVSFEASMADLERMQGPAEVVLDEAAKILGIDLEQTIQRSFVGPFSKTTFGSQGFKEQWVLRWLLRKLKLGVPDSKSNGAAEEAQRSFAANAKFWSLLLSLTCSIPSDVCSEILSERHFYAALADMIREVLVHQGRGLTTFDASTTDYDHEGPPTKKRRLSPASDHQQKGAVELDRTIWIASHAACRCVDLFSSSSSDVAASSRQAPLWTGSLHTQSTLLGVLLESIVSIVRHGSRIPDKTLVAAMLNATLSFWESNVSVSNLKDDERQQAFASHCLIPCLSLLDHLMDARFNQTPLMPSRTTLERLIAVNVVFPLRTTFSEQFTKKWRATADILLYEQMDTLLRAYNRQARPSQDGSDVSQVVSGSSVQRSSWIIFDVAARSISFTDLRRRQQEQHYLDSLLIWLVHVTWPHIPRVTSTGILRQQFAEDQSAWVSPLELLLDVARSRRLHISIPIVSYILQAVLDTDSQSAPWSLLVKVIQLDSNILVPVSTALASRTFLSQVVSRIESSTVTRSEYDLLRDRLILPLMRDCARSRAYGVFVEAWQQCLADSIRTRYTSKYSQDEIPAMLVWEDDDVFDEFKTLSVLHAPPGLASRMLEDVVESVKGLGDKIGSTTEEFAKLATFSALLESTYSSGEQLGLSMDQLASLLFGAVDVLRRKSDFQGQRWRLRKLIRLLVESAGFEALPPWVDSLLEPNCNFVSLNSAFSFDPDHTRTQSGKFLECLECFTLVVELAAKSRRFVSKMEVEMHHLQEKAAQMTNRPHLWNGRDVECCDVEGLVIACIGRLLQRRSVFSMYPDVFRQFIGDCVEEVTKSPPSKLAETPSPNLLDLWMAVLQDDAVVCAPLLRKTLLEGITAALPSGETDLMVCRSVLESLGIETMGRVSVDKLANGMRDRLFQSIDSPTRDSIAKDMSYLIYLDTLFPGIFINTKHLDEWWNLSATQFEFKHADPSPLAAIKRAHLSNTYLLAVEMLKQVLQAIWTRAIALHNTTSSTDHVSWMVKRFEESEKQSPLPETLPFSCIQMLLLCAFRSTVSDKAIVQDQRLQEMKKFYHKRTIHHLELMSQEPLTQNTIFLLKLALDGFVSRLAFETEETIQQATGILIDKLRGFDHSHAECPFAKLNGQVGLSIRRKCLSLGMQSEAGHVQEEVSEWLQELLSCDDHSGVWTHSTISSLAARADLFTRQRGAGEWSMLLQVLRQKSQDASCQPTCAVVVASVLTHVKQQHIAQYPWLAQELAEVASLPSHAEQLQEVGLALALENCKQVLELHPVVINQSTLDRLLSSLRIVASSTTGTAHAKDVTKLESMPSAGHLYDRLCVVVGAILGRHRRRLSDRYHLLLPVLQALLRCLFWPGKKSVKSHRGTAVKTLVTFGKTLPGWVRDSSGPLSLSSADQISRLLSSVCNPTVSAARSSNKRRNELNDEVKKARKLAGEHMQYLVSEYCRCFLDGQIVPSTKDQLMAGMYRVLDAIDRDMLRAMNAGMDPSTRAVFKNLYDDYHRYGKWDKS